jgi:hypothetical protein
MREYVKSGKSKHHKRQYQLSQTESSVERELEVDKEDSKNSDWISAVRSKDHEFSIKLKEFNEDNESFQYDGVQESPSHHAWNYDLEEEK